MLVPVIIILLGVIGFYYLGDCLFEKQDMIYPELMKKGVASSLTFGIWRIVLNDPDEQTDLSDTYSEKVQELE